MTNNLRFLHWSMASAAALICLLSSGLRPLAADWPMEGANAQRTGATDESLPAELELLWETRYEGLGFDAGPIIADGKVFANDHDGRIYALDLATGKELWKVETDSGFVATPSYLNGILYACDYDGGVRALDANSGAEQWVFETAGEIKVGPSFYKDSLLITSEDGSLYRVQLAGGKEVWKYESEQPILCGAALAGSQTFLGGCDEYLHVVDLESGQRLGEPIKIGPTGSTPAVTEQLVIVPNQQGGIFGFGRKPVKEQWFTYDEKLSDEFRNSAATSGGLVVATGRNKRVFALDIKSGEVAWQQMLRKRADASPIIAGDSVFVAAADGRILRYDLTSGKEQWMYEVKGAFLAAPAAADGRLVLTNDRGSIFCFGKKK